MEEVGVKTYMYYTLQRLFTLPMTLI